MAEENAGGGDGTAAAPAPPVSNAEARRLAREEKQRLRKEGNQGPKGGPPPPPPKPRAKRHFILPPGLPGGSQQAIYEDDVVGHLQPAEETTKMGPVPKVFAALPVARETVPPNYTDEMRLTAEASGFKGAAGRMLRTKARVDDRNLRAELNRNPPIEPGSVSLGDQQIRKAFGVLDLAGDGRITTDELRHVFAQLGELPTQGEIEAMIYLCARGGSDEPGISFEDFSAVMLHPSEALRRIDSKKLREVLRGGEEGDSESESEDETPEDSSEDDDEED
jgi:hypothetical protein